MMQFCNFRKREFFDADGRPTRYPEGLRAPLEKIAETANHWRLPIARLRILYIAFHSRVMQRKSRFFARVPEVTHPPVDERIAALERDGCEIIVTSA